MVLPGLNEVEMDCLGGDGRDLESLEHLPRGFSWPRSWTAQTDRSGLNSRAASISSAVSHWSVQWIARWSPARRRAPETHIPSIASLSESQNNFFISILGESPQSELQLQDACAWYIGYLEFKIRENWVGLFRDLLKKVNPLSETPCNQDLSATFEVLKVVVDGLSREGVSLNADLVDTLDNDNLLKYTNDERTHAKQLVFVVFGWITTLYPAGFDPEAKTLQIINTSSGTSTKIRRPTKRQASRHRIKTFAVYEQSLEYNEDLLDQPLHTLLGRFGRIIPQRNRQSPITGLSTPLHHIPARPDEQWIESVLLCFHTLEKVAFIKLEWVDSLSLHLEFDRSTNVLKIFRLPSLCLIMSSCDKLSPLSQIFYDADDSTNYLPSPLTPEDAADFYKEILLSYRLLFSQSSSSLLPLLPSPPFPQEYHDPLLPILCCHHWESHSTAKAIYEMIDADDPQALYSPTVDFPYLGKRLLEVQRYVRGHKVSGFWGLWYDKRDHAAWWAFWAVIIIGGITVIITTLLGVLQLAVGVLQVQYAKDQLAQQSLASAAPGG